LGTSSYGIRSAVKADISSIDGNAYEETWCVKLDTALFVTGSTDTLQHVRLHKQGTTWLVSFDYTTVDNPFVNEPNWSRHGCRNWND
jgi:hypothetical protein